MSFSHFFLPEAKLKFLVALIGFFLFGSVGVSTASGQHIDAKIKVLSDSRVRIEGKFLDPKFTTEKNWTFLQRYADVEDLGRRIDKLTVFDKDGIEIAVKKFAPGIYEAAEGAVTWQYEVDVTPPGEATAAAHVSWLTADGGLLMPEDLLPRLLKNEGTDISAKLTFELPDDWSVNSAEVRAEIKAGENYYLLEDISKGVFRVGKNWREKELVLTTMPNRTLNLSIAGEWQFTDEDALRIAASILEEHNKTFGEIPASRMSIMLSPFPRQVEAGRWRAETRGSTVVLMSSRMPFGSQGANRLHEQLRHEIFHYWIPNKLSLTGNYDWFFEGFTLYQALKTGKKLDRIRFSDLLDTLGRAYTLSENSSKGLSLIEASKKRWDGNFGFINSRGMIVAFMCDVAMLEASRGRRSLTDLFQKLYRLHKTGSLPADGNAAILEIMKGYPELNTIRQDHIEGGKKLELGHTLSLLGAESEVKAGLTQIRLRQKPSGGQKRLLVKLGLNPLYELPEKAK